jgi:gluconolactonase
MTNNGQLQALLPNGTTPKQVFTGAIWSEGPCWIPQRKALRWSDIPNNRILEYFPATGETQVYKTDVEFTNGRTLDLDGSVLQCSHGYRRIERDREGEVSSVIDSYDGVRFNSPNDIVVSRDGTVWFTDPPYGIIVEIEGHPGVKEYQDCYVFAIDAKSKKLRPVVTDVEEPNGLAFSPDESILYVADTSVLFKATGNHHIRAYDMQDGRAKNGRTIITIKEGVIDGFRVDTHGNLWCSSEIGVQIFTAGGVHIGTIPTPEKVGNLAFGGDDGTDLFIAANTSLYQIKTSANDAAKHY